jgi:general secretion pathway protein A
MYESFYGFREKPFQLPPDPEYVFMSNTHQEVFTHLEYAIQEKKGFVVITGEIGAGKTTLMNVLLNRIPQDVETAVITQTNLQPGEFLRRVCDEFELDIISGNMSEMLDSLHEFLLRQYQEGRRVVLIVDESQNLPLRTIEELRMLSNLELEKEHLLQMILLGQPNLRDKLRKKELEQFSQRISVHCHLRRLNRQETEKYIQHRLKVAGGKDPDLFTKEAVDYVYRGAKGIPRLINILCDGALLYGYADELKTIEKQTVLQIIKERQSLITSSQEEAPSNQGLLSGQEDLIDRIDSLEGHLERLYMLINKHVHELTSRENELEARIEKKVRNMIQALKPHESAPLPRDKGPAPTVSPEEEEEEDNQSRALSRFIKRFARFGRN